MRNVNFTLEGVGEWEVLVPPTVYPPKEDSMMLCRVVSELPVNHGCKALEIGCGSGLVSIVLASKGWKVTSCDVNPYAVSSTRGNMEMNGLSEGHKVIESGVGEGMSIPEGTDLIVWNLPYLAKDEVNHGIIGEMEEAAFSDIPHGGWGGELLRILEDENSSLCDEVLVILVMRTEPEGDSKVLEWEEKGWSWRSLEAERYGTEKIEVIGFWRTGSGVEATVLETCESSMDEAALMPVNGWQRVFSKAQTKGRGRGGTDWISEEGGVFATWNLDSELLDYLTPGLIQTSIGALVSDTLGANMKWPNDIIDDEWRKMGGVLMESSNNDAIRVGVGVNRNDFQKGGVSGSGWERSIGPIDAAEVFLRIDRRISSIFENTGMLAPPEPEWLTSTSWKSLSRSLSRGVLGSMQGNLVRPCGLNVKGEIEVVGAEGIALVRELDKIEWISLDD
ncbi:MAG TPA: methyltransferase [Candidatus Thalassarchaeaceae archaeon]|nr:methyltransferase [Candidatus Thalassarchaeaceae archaeon]